jgi:SAM-dependent methyltransferase
MERVPRWFAHGPGHAQWYIERFRRMAAEGADLAGEARFMDVLVPPHSRVLDAGCGTGRLGAELHRRGHDIIGVDVDPQLIEAARTDHPGPVWLVADLATFDLSEAGYPEQFDAAVLAGNVMTYVAPETEADVLRRVAAHVKPEGAIVVGFGLDRGYALDAFDTDIAKAGLRLEQRFATWDLRPWTPEADFAVSVLRHGG